jgi:hypothetical protein
MTITAKFPGFCKKCRRQIAVGEKIEWQRGAGASHTECPAKDESVIRIERGEGYGGEPYEVGKLVAQTKGPHPFVVVLRASKRYYREDGMSFGVGDDQGYIFEAECRPATAEEITGAVNRAHEAALRVEAARRLAVIEREIQTTADRPADKMDFPAGEKLGDTFNIYGGGKCWVITDTHIWFIQNNGMDGGAWDGNNIRTGGAGAIGWRVPRTEELEAAIRAVHQERSA